MKLKVYGTENCPECQVVKKYLLALGADFEEIKADQPEVVEYIENKTGQRKIPLIENGKGWVVGFKPDQLKNLVSE